MAATFPRWKSVLGAVAISSVALLAAAPPALAQDGGGGPDPTAAPAQERVSSEVLPGVVFLKTDVHTYLRNSSTGSLYGPFDFSASCTGFAVNQNGYVATAGHCVNDDDIRESVAIEIANAYVQENGGDANAVAQSIVANFKLEGEAAGSPADKKVTVVQAGQGQNQTPMQAQIVDSRSNAQGDVALVKVNATNMQTIEVAPPGPVNTGTQILTIGYPAARNEVIDPSLAPTYKEGSVSSQQNRNGVPFLEITADMGHGMSGGPTVNQQGQVIGINSMGVGDDSDSFNFVAPSSALLDLMSRNGIRPEAGPADAAYRTGLNDYYQGYYSDAEADFQKVLDQAPDNKPAQEFKSKAVRAHDQFGDKGMGLLGWGLVGGGALLVLVAGGVVILVARRRRGDGSAPVVAASAPVGPAPQGHPQAPAQPQHAWNAPGTAQPFGLPAGYSAPVPGMPEQPQVPAQRAPQHQAAQHQAAQHYSPQPAQVQHRQARSFGSTPLGSTPLGTGHEVETGPQSPAVGFPSPVAAPAPAAVAAAPVSSTDATERVVRSSVPAAPAAGFCSRCGAARATGARFCGACGAGTS